jgi:beta-glucanase (GH16 family)
MRPRVFAHALSFIVVVALLCTGCAALKKATPGHVAPGRVLFFDDFSGGSLKLSKWQPNWLGANSRSITKPVNGEERSCYAPSQVSVSGGTLHLRAVSRHCRAENGRTYAYASGLVNTRQHFTFKYGRMEARVWMPPGSSRTHNWPAFWADGTGAWPKTGELDVVEGLSGANCYHFHSPAGGPGSCAAMRNAGGWHTFAADWRRGRVSYFYDGKLVGTIRRGVTNAPMFLILNLGVSSSISPPIRVPSEMRVDWVRVTA